MILKHVPRCPDYDRLSSSFFDVGVEVNTGTHYFHEPPQDRDYAQALGIEAKWCHVLDIDTEPQEGQQWPVRFAYWRDKNDSLRLLVTNGELYLMSDTGKTIDRVR